MNKENKRMLASLFLEMTFSILANALSLSIGVIVGMVIMLEYIMKVLT